MLRKLGAANPYCYGAKEGLHSVRTSHLVGETQGLTVANRISVEPGMGESARWLRLGYPTLQFPSRENSWGSGYGRAGRAPRRPGAGTGRAGPRRAPVSAFVPLLPEPGGGPESFVRPAAFRDAADT